MAETSASKLSKRIHTDGSTHYKGTTAPANPVEGDLWYDTTIGTLKSYDGSNFVKVAAEISVLTSVTGNIFAGQTSNLTLNGSGFLSSNLVVNFLQASDVIDVDVTVTPTNDSSATVTVPSSVYSNVTNGNVVTIKVTNSDGKSSGNQTITASAPPYNADFLVIAGGGGGSEGTGGGGGGAGGYRNSYSTESSGGGGTSETALSFIVGTVYTITVGGGGAGSTYNGRGDSGSNSSISGSDITTITSIGGGAGGAEGVGIVDGLDGGSGGGGAFNSGSGGSGTSAQGFDGGDGIYNGVYLAGGGGGAGAIGANG